MRTVRIDVLVSAVLIFGCISLEASVHPVPIDAKTDCTTCHQDKVEGKDVHPAVQMGCTTCHRVVDRKGVSYVEMEGGGVPTLCFQCHDDKKIGDHAAAHPMTFVVAGSTGALGPNVVECTACHNPHSSRFPHLLIKAESGGKGENLCLDCHKKGENVPKSGSRHLALDSGCDTCHALHKQGNPALSENIFQLKKAAPQLCLDCHDASSADLKKAHHDLPFAAADCTTCHDPHSSNAAGLQQKVAHAPYAAGSCDKCHSGGAGDSLKFVDGGGNALCISCHQRTVKQTEDNAVQHAAIGLPGSCTTCHDPHASRNDALISPDPVRACEKCHAAQQRLQMTAKVVHAPVFDRNKGCVVCHAAHGSQYANLLRQPGAKVCLVCHTDMALGQAKGKEIPVFGGKISISRRYLEQTDKVSLHQAHTEGLPDPRDSKQTITCTTCHVPHGGGHGLLVTGSAKTEKLCLECHSISSLS